jgi:hypothetical protein
MRACQAASELSSAKVLLGELVACSWSTVVHNLCGRSAFVSCARCLRRQKQTTLAWARAPKRPCYIRLLTSRLPTSFSETIVHRAVLQCCAGARSLACSCQFILGLHTLPASHPRCTVGLGLLMVYWAKRSQADVAPSSFSANKYWLVCIRAN